MVDQLSKESNVQTTAAAAATTSKGKQEGKEVSLNFKILMFLFSNNKN
jgi:hypothetical protein